MFGSVRFVKAAIEFPVVRQSEPHPTLDMRRGRASSEMVGEASYVILIPIGIRKYRRRMLF